MCRDDVRPSGLSKPVVIGVTPFKGLITLRITYLLSPWASI